jgi:hypothetical protein
VSVKDRRNFCDYFSPSRTGGGKSEAAKKSAQARKKLEELFGKK